jgi:hypothetical protein
VKNRPKAATRDGWGILNPFGDMWTHHLFSSPEQAKKHFDLAWAGVAGATRPEWSDYKAVWCRQRTAPIREPKQVRK